MPFQLGSRGFRADLPAGLQLPPQQWHAKVTVTVTGALETYALRLPGWSMRTVVYGAPRRAPVPATR